MLRLIKQSRKNELDEALLVKQAKDGDHSAFEELYKLNVNKIYAVSLRISADESAAEDITQDSFVKAWLSLRSFQGESMFSTWLYRIAVNTSLIYLRKKKRKLTQFLSLSSLIKLDKRPGLFNPESMDIEKAVSRLPEKARLVFILHDVEGFRHNEIAEMMNISSGTTKAQLHRARKLLREDLER